MNERAEVLVFSLTAKNGKQGSNMTVNKPTRVRFSLR